jgi:hypothetical protein
MTHEMPDPKKPRRLLSYSVDVDENGEIRLDLYNVGQFVLDEPNAMHLYHSIWHSIEHGRRIRGLLQRVRDLELELARCE